MPEKCYSWPKDSEDPKFRAGDVVECEPEDDDEEDRGKVAWVVPEYPEKVDPGCVPLCLLGADPKKGFFCLPKEKLELASPLPF